MPHSTAMLTSIPLHHLTACKYINMGMAVDKVEQPTSSQPALNIITDARLRKPRIILPTHQKRPSLSLPRSNRSVLLRQKQKEDSLDEWRCLLLSTMDIGRGIILLHQTQRNHRDVDRWWCIKTKPPPPNTPRRSGEGVGGVTRRQIYGGQKKKEKE